MNEIEFKEVFLAGYLEGVEDAWLEADGFYEIGVLSTGKRRASEAWKQLQERPGQTKC